jgi:uncharacterized membrane protein
VLNASKLIKHESENWVKDGIITPEQQTLILARYPEKAKGNPLLVFFSIIGFLLIGSGIILIFATNWWRIPLPIRLFLSFVPLWMAMALCAYTALKKYASAPFREGCATFLSLSFFATLALVTQSFHSHNDIQLYLLICGLGTLPVAYLFKSKAALSVSVGCGLAAPFFGFPLLLAIPMFYFELRKDNSRVLHSYLLLLFAALAVRTLFEYMQPASMHIMWSAGMLFILLDGAYRKVSPMYFRTPLKVFGCLVFGIYIGVMSWNWDTSYIIYSRPLYEFPWMPLVLFCAYLSLRIVKWYGPVPTDALAASAMVLALLPASQGIVANIFMLALGILLIFWGSKKFHAIYLNTGMVLLVALIGMRFFDSNLSLLVRGIVFILLGAGFLAANIFISRIKKKGDAAV